MKKVILYAITILVTIIGAEENCNVPRNPDGSCQQIGYVCNLGFNVVEEDNIMFFHLGADSTCGNLLTSSLAPKSNIQTPDTTAWFFLRENKDNMTPLALTLAGSLAMLAVNNGIQVSIIYKKVGNIPFEGIKLLSIQLYNTPITPITP